MILSKLRTTTTIVQLPQCFLMFFDVFFPFSAFFQDFTCNSSRRCSKRCLKDSKSSTRPSSVSNLVRISQEFFDWESQEAIEKKIWKSEKDKNSAVKISTRTKSAFASTPTKPRSQMWKISSIVWTTPTILPNRIRHGFVTLTTCCWLFV